MNYQRIFDKFNDQNVFIKTTAKTVIEGPQKAALNRKGNTLFNSGDIEGARRIFITTGYSDGLTRIGDHYLSKGKSLDALKMYWIAPDRNKAEPIIAQLSEVIRNLLLEKEGIYNE